MALLKRVALSCLLLGAACTSGGEGVPPRTPSVEPTPAGDPVHEPSQTGTGTGTDAPVNESPSSDSPSGGPTAN